MGLGSRIEGRDLRFWDLGLGCRVQGLEFRIRVRRDFAGCRIGRVHGALHGLLCLWGLQSCAHKVCGSHTV